MRKNSHFQVEIPVAQRKELDRRIKRYKKGETSFVTWETIKNELKSLN